MQSFLQKVLGRGDGSQEKRESFRLPGVLFDGVRVLLVDSGDPTDLLFSMPLVEEIKDRYPKAEVDLVSDERTHHLALSTGMFSELIVCTSDQLKLRSKGFESLVEAVSAESWDVTILLGRYPDAAREELALASGAPLRLGAAHDRSYPRINCAVRATPESHYPYRRTATWGRLFGLPLDHAPLHWPLLETRQRQTAQLVHFNKPRKDQLLIGVDPGQGKEGTLLGAENLAFLANHLGKRHPSKTIVLSGDENPERTEVFARLLTVETLELPRPTLMETVLLLSQCSLFVAGNTDLFHFSVALGVPTLGLFTTRDGERWRPDEDELVELIELQDGGDLDLSAVMASVDGLLE